MTDTAPAHAAAPSPSPSPSPGRTTLQHLRSLGSGPRGLTEAEAERRLARHGENVPPGTRPLSWPRLAARSLRDPFTAVLLCLGLVSATVAAWGTACVILVLVAVSCGLRSAGERRADSAMAGLRDLVATTATVLRRPGDDASGPPGEREIPVGQLVPGDVVRLGPGDLVPADVRLLRAQGLTVQQAAFTGESVPVGKHPVDLPADGESAHLCFQGGSVASGSASAVVLATGADTRFAADRRTAGARRAASAFDRSVHGISWTLIRFMLLTPPLVLMAGAALRGRGLETLPFAVAVAVGLTPEMLPVIVTTALARGSALLARTHGVIVKRLPALHDIGAVDILCVDKTGTLTQDRPDVDPDRTDPEALHWAAVSAWWTLQLAELPAPDALDEAVIDEALTADPDVIDAYDGVTALPFDPVRRLATAVVQRPGALGTVTLAVKGSVENVLERCALDDAERARLLARAAALSGDGLRLLAVATAERPARHRPYSTADERGLTFTGFVAFTDALVPTAAQALRDLGERGVTVKVITGDHPGTAARALRDLGLDPGDVRTADSLDALTDAELARLAHRTTVFARCAPAHKARIVTALRAGGETTVGFLGDGVNDLPALRAADVGICPRDAVPVARDTADIVLAEARRGDGPADRPGKDLTAIGHAISAGRHSSGNIATYLRVTLSSNLGNVIAMLSAGLLLPFLPMLPAQVLAQNLCFDAAQLSFAFDRPAAAALRRPSTLRPRDFLRFITGFGVLNAAADLATFGALALALHTRAGPGEAAFHAGWFTENLLTQGLVMLLLRTGRGGSGPRRRTPSPVRWAVAALAVVGIALPLTPVAGPLGMTPLPPVYYALLAAVLALYALALTAVKRRYLRQD
ncbi:magnesium-translocating P-type ATPase [Streptomyces sp. NPDC058067]|uniref:magnesium-translocating P-type ATPase n=1 Tax=Streptomyces sp. NPDC058067 TaxID=3346324 RepID=UPI0036F17BE6